MTKSYFYLILFFFFSIIQLNAQFQDTIIITDDDLLGDTTYHWTNENLYILQDLVYLEENGILNIDSSTVIKGRPGSMLIITQGAQIFARGTKDKPIIFTSENDDTNVPDDLPLTFSANNWGGLVILGKAYLNTDEIGEGDVFRVATLEENIIPINDSRHAYGGNISIDNSGILQYISIRHTGGITEESEYGGLILAGIGEIVL